MIIVKKNGVSFFWCTFETVKMSTTTTTYFVYFGSNLRGEFCCLY